MMDPVTVTPSEQALGWAAKIGSMFLAFVAGIVTATWTVASKVKGYDIQIQTLQEELAKMAAERTNMQAQINRKLDKLHSRIDDILLQCGAPNHDFRMIKREDDDEYES